ncbi:unnamed protein product [Closterium sp. NIES-53]
MASHTVLSFDAEGRAVDFDVWVDDLQLFLQCDSRDGVSLFDHTSGVSTAPAATADCTVRSQWTTRDVVARLAVRSHLPPAERTHFGQYKTAQSLYDAVVARYSSPATAALSRLMLPYLFPDLAAFAIVADLGAHLRTADARYRAALPAEDHFLSLCPTELTVNLLEERLAAAEKSILAVGASRGDRRTPFFEGCSPVPLLPSVASAAAVDLVGTEEVGAASTPSGIHRNSKGKGSKGGGGGDGGSSGGGGGGGGGGSGGGGGTGSGGVCGGGGGRGGGGGGGRGSGSGGGGGGGGGVGRGAAAQSGGFGGSQRQQQLRTRETPSVQQLREWYAGRGWSGGAGPCPYVLRTGTRIGEVCGLPHTTQRCFDRGGEFSSDLLRAFERSEGIRQTFTLPDSPQQNGIAERRIGMVMDVARTSMIHPVAPHFLWPFAVQYAAHQINLQPRVSLPETTRTLRWTGKVGDASAFRVWGSRDLVRDNTTDKLSSRAVPCVFLGFPPDAPGWQFYHPTSHCVLSLQDVTFDESVSYYHPAEPVEVAVDTGAARGAEPVGVWTGGGGTGGAEPERVEPGGAESGGAESGRAEPGRAEPGDAEPGCVEPAGTVSGGAEPARAASGGALGFLPQREPLSPQQLREWYSRHCRGAVGAGAAGAAGASGGNAGAGGAAGAGAAGAAGGTARAGGGAEPASAESGGALGVPSRRKPLSPQQLRGWYSRRCRGATGASGGAAGVGAAEGTTGAGGAAGARAAGGAAGTGDPGVENTGSVSAVSRGAAQPRPYYVPLLQQVLGSPPTPGPPPPFLSPPRVQSQSQLQPASPLPGPSPYSGPTTGLTECREPESRPVSPESCSASPVRTVRAGRFSRPCPPVPGTHSMTLCPSTATQRVPLPSPPASSLPAGPDPASDSLRAASPAVTRFLATAVTDPLFQSTAASALNTELVAFAAACRLDYATSLVVESASASICPPSVGGECAVGRTVKRPPGSPPVFKARYVARGFSQRQGVDFFHTFSPTPKMTTLRVLLHVAAQRDYELHLLDFSTASLQGSLHEEI